MQKCSYPDCNYVAEMITNNHCQITHGVSKKEVLKAHGSFKDYFVIARSKDKDGLEHVKY